MAAMEKCMFVDLLVVSGKWLVCFVMLSSGWWAGASGADAWALIPLGLVWVAGSTRQKSVLV